ncbi:MAG: translation initiation factor IF-2 subunit beta [Desulfurococcales archaeon]|nr:translation initiation factor IF-2 subunit beta [Desulfurococcales archaeon]MEB3806243.1 translation initiation factor IF-2 subunit beta [Desulfurococcales archaeon]
MEKAEAEKLKDYEWLLERLYQKVPPKSGSAEYRLPELQVLRIGSQTIIQNFREISMRLKRDPQIVARYLQKELAAAGSYDPNSGQLVLNVKVSRKVLAKFLDLFLKNYVKCPTCGSVDTRLEKRGRTWVLVCEACGAEQPVKPI